MYPKSKDIFRINYRSLIRRLTPQCPPPPKYMGQRKPQLPAPLNPLPPSSTKIWQIFKYRMLLYLHLFVNDDSGYTLSSTKHPLLSTVGLLLFVIYWHHLRWREDLWICWQVRKGAPHALKRSCLHWQENKLLRNFAQEFVTPCCRALRLLVCQRCV